jgi:hypothetical protein
MHENKLIILVISILALFLLYRFVRSNESFQLQNECPICFESGVEMVSVCRNTQSQYKSIIKRLLDSGMSSQDADRIARYSVPLHEICKKCSIGLATSRCPICRGPATDAQEQLDLLQSNLNKLQEALRNAFDRQEDITREDIIEFRTTGEVSGNPTLSNALNLILGSGQGFVQMAQEALAARDHTFMRSWSRAFDQLLKDINSI